MPPGVAAQCAGLAVSVTTVGTTQVPGDMTVMCALAMCDVLAVPRYRLCTRERVTVVDKERAVGERNS